MSSNIDRSFAENTPRPRLDKVRGRLGPWRSGFLRFLSSTPRRDAIAELSRDDSPLRGDLYSAEQLERHARSLASMHEVARHSTGEHLLHRLDDNARVLSSAYDAVVAAAEANKPVAPAGEWLLDNFYIIEEQILAVRQYLPKGFSRELPSLASGDAAGLPRVYDLALQLIMHTDARVDAESLAGYVGSYQTVRPLKLGELWAMPIMLRVALLENLRRVASRVAVGRREGDKADLWADRLIETAERQPRDVVLVLADLVQEAPDMTPAFVAGLARRLQGTSPSLQFAMQWIEQRLAEIGMTTGGLIASESQTQAADQVSIGNAIISLRTIAAMDWPEFVESLAMPEMVLRGDPADVYGRMSFGTRDRYRHVVEKVARLSIRSEIEVAEAAVRLARESTDDGSEQSLKRRHVGWWLIGDGRDMLERRCAARRGIRGSITRLCKLHPLWVYAGAITVLTLLQTAAVLAGGVMVNSPLWLLLAIALPLLLAASTVSVSLVNWLITLIIHPHALPRMDYKRGVPCEARTIVAVPTMLTSEAGVAELLESLEIRFLANRDRNVLFALLTDFPDADEPLRPGDSNLLELARRGVERLNRRYAVLWQPRQGELVESDGIVGDRFFLLHRPRKLNERQGVWMGWERKRGKIAQFNALLRNPNGPAKDEFEMIVGDTYVFPSVRYVITLDTDTALPPEAARQLIATIAHPMNAAEYDPRKGRVVRGYSILQPRVATSLSSSRKSRYAMLLSGDAGIDPYTRAVSDVYHDLFEEGSYIGKGIYEVDAFEKALGERLPDNRILSHDLLEGAYARAGLVSDVILLEDHPSSYLADANRRHRWIRGDWQIASWLLPRVPGASGAVSNPISRLSRWKIADNLRRSLVPPAFVFLFVMAWLVSQTPGFWTAALLIGFVLPWMLGVVVDFCSRQEGMPLLLHWRYAAQTAARRMTEAGVALFSVPHEAERNIDAIIRTLYRVHISHRKMLEWTTSTETDRRAKDDLASFYAAMWAGPALSLGVTVLLFLIDALDLLVAGPVLLAWAIGPAVAWSLSRAIPPRGEMLDAEAVTQLRLLARRTFRFFDVYVNAADNYLPPDNVHEVPVHAVAHRTSPTNIGMGLLCHVAAHDFGHVSTGYLMHRTGLTFNAMERLERWHGHFYNWYDTRTLQTLPPDYVSSVDSGNLIGSLLILRPALLEIADTPILPASAFGGLADTVSLLTAAARGTDRVVHRPRRSTLTQELLSRLDRMAEELRRPPRNLSSATLVLRRLLLIAGEAASQASPAEEDEVRYWSRALERQVREFVEEAQHFTPFAATRGPSDGTWRRGDADQIERLSRLRTLLQELDAIPQLSRIAALRSSGVQLVQSIRAHWDEDDRWLVELQEQFEISADRAASRIEEARDLARRCVALAEADFTAFYDRSRDLLRIGYCVRDERMDAGHYDLLASESRIGSFTGIAVGQLPQEHWFALGRKLTTTGGEPTLVSWSGSMFEYLMPQLIFPCPEATLLEQTNESMIDRQIAYARGRGVPWGISESGYNATDAAMNYQYKAFGVPGLGFKRGLADDLVIAPYATVMALMVRPNDAYHNLQRLIDDGQLGGLGLYEAVDYTPARVPRGQKFATVRQYMSHHQGMAYLALAYTLLDQPMQKRFNADPRFRAAELLLQERIPKLPPVYPHAAEAAATERHSVEQTQAVIRFFRSPDTRVPEVHLLSNGNLTTMTTAAGSGYIRWRDMAVTRWREDPAIDGDGVFIYIRDLGTGEFWSATHQPVCRKADNYEAIFSQARAEFRRRDSDIDTHVEIAVSPEDDVELRRVTLTNRGKTSRTIELTSYAEVVLAAPEADLAHPAFSNLFVQTRLLSSRQAIIATRRPRSENERNLCLLHLMAVHGPTTDDVYFETDRAVFTGRGRTLANPQAMDKRRLNNTHGSVLDPVVSVRRTVVIEPGMSVKVDVVTGVAETVEHAGTLVERYHDRRLADRVFDLAWTHSQVSLRQIDADEADAQLYGRLASSVIYHNPAKRAAPTVIARNQRGQNGLWSYGISGDLPIILLRVSDRNNIELVKQVVRAHHYWRIKGLKSDLVIWNEDLSGYRQELQEMVQSAVAAVGDIGLMDKTGGIFVRRLDQINEDDRVLMQTVARVILTDTAGSLAEQLDKRPAGETPVPRLVPSRPRREVPTAPEVQSRALIFNNGIGGFTPDGREYVVTTTPETATPAPWCNVIASPFIGTVITDSGSAYTWAENAREYRLTPWLNDPVSEHAGECFYIRDEESGRFFSPCPYPVRGPMPYVTRHGFGYSIFEYAEAGIASTMTTYVSLDAPVRYVHIKLRNTGSRSRKLSVTGMVEWTLSDQRPKAALHIVTETEAKTGAVLARNSYSPEFGDRVAFFDCSESQRWVTGDRMEFIGRNGARHNPAAMGRTRLSGKIGAGLDPCAAIMAPIELAEGQEKEIVFILGAAKSRAQAVSLVNKNKPLSAAQDALEKTWQFWNRTLGTLYVETPDPAVNVLANGWLEYQVLACRYWGRSGFYQSGGAYGFRDQLQDVMALLHSRPELFREHLLRAAEHQFKEGDVQHWWHPPVGRGVRTHFSDDYLWLPFAVARYVNGTGDTGVLDEKLHFLEGRPVGPDEESYYDLPNRTEEQGTLYDHAKRAIINGLRYGEHGLPLMGCGDWNDGMNLVGIGGKGESVWLAWFLRSVATDFAAVADTRGDHDFATQCRGVAGQMLDAVQANAWDGNWYRRAYFDSGEPLGSASNPECRIDSLPQSWAVLADSPDRERAKQALDAVDQHLVKRDARLIQLFDPPFDNSHLDPGYIKGYVPGVRENGGQYTHAAIWTVMAFARSGDTERAWELFNLINPVNHGSTRAGIETYKVEPFVAAADVYAVQPHIGRGGWTWYTGSAGWMYRLITESLLGIELHVDHLTLKPLLPEKWPGFKLVYRWRDTFHHISVQRGPKSILIDSIPIEGDRIPLFDDQGEHHIEVNI